MCYGTSSYTDNGRQRERGERGERGLLFHGFRHEGEKGGERREKGREEREGTYA